MDLKRAFIKKAVESYMREVTHSMDVRINQLKVVDTGGLKASPSSSVHESGSMGAEGKLMFSEHGRFVDMGVNRYYPIGRMKSQLKDKATKLKPRKFYSKVAYGKLNGLMGDLSYGFTEEAISLLKSELQNGNTTN